MHISTSYQARKNGRYLFILRETWPLNCKNYLDIAECAYIVTLHFRLRNTKVILKKCCLSCQSLMRNYKPFLNPHPSADLITFTEEILNGKLYSLRSEYSSKSRLRFPILKYCVFFYDVIKSMNEIMCVSFVFLIVTNFTFFLPNGQVYFNLWKKNIYDFVIWKFLKYTKKFSKMKLVGRRGGGILNLFENIYQNLP